MMAYAEIAVAILAAGQGRRFGSDKLMADLDGIPMGLHIAQTLKELPFRWRFAVCSKDAILAKHFSAAGFAVVSNVSPETGQAHSLHLAVRAAEETDARALLLVLADMPFVTASHIVAMVAAYQGKIVASTEGTAPTPPTIFPRDAWPMLLTTTGDAGARELIGNVTLIPALPSELRDIDVATDLPNSRSL